MADEATCFRLGVAGYAAAGYAYGSAQARAYMKRGQQNARSWARQMASSSRQAFSASGGMGMASGVIVVASSTTCQRLGRPGENFQWMRGQRRRSMRT